MSAGPSPLYFAERLTEHLGGAKIYFKRDELNHTGAHKINNCSARSCWPSAWARRASSPRPAPASTASPPPPSARASAAVRGLHGRAPTSSGRAQRLPHEAAGRRGAMPVTSGAGTLKDAMNEALRDWVTNVDDTFYIIGTSPARIPIRRWCATSSRDRQGGARADAGAEGRLPDALVACIGGGSNAIGLFHPFLDDPSSVKIIGVEAAGTASMTERACASLTGGRPACCTATAPICCRTPTARSSRALDLGRPRLSRHRPGAFLAA
jgi:tryptophan synthase beta chain